MAHRRSVILSAIALCAAVALAVAINIINLLDAYGSGAPYYSRTTNMDKWLDPLPALAVLDLALLVVVLPWLLWLKRMASRGRKNSAARG